MIRSRGLLGIGLALLVGIAPLSSRLHADTRVVVLHTLRAEPMSEDAPAFSVTDIDGKPFVLSEHLGHPIVLHFWATWCEPCRHELPALGDAFRRLGDNDAKFIAISIDHDLPLEQIRAAAHAFNLPFPVAVASTGGISERYWALGIPMTYFVDRRGRLTQRFRGSSDWSSPTAQRALAELVSSPRVAP